MIILASNSPRRRELFAGLGLPFEVKVIPGLKESYPSELSVMDIAEFIAVEKTQAYLDTLSPEDVLITADTVVISGNEVLGKPKDANEARRMLQLLSGHTHQVVTGVCITKNQVQEHFAVTTDVTFKSLTDEEINFYIEHYHPYDKAGAYGIQEWIGFIGVIGLKGSYYNVMGLPVQRIYEILKKLKSV